MSDHDPPNEARRSGDRPPPRNAFERWLRRFENPTVGDLIIVVGLIPVIALLALVVFVWLLSG